MRTGKKATTPPTRCSWPESGNRIQSASVTEVCIQAVELSQQPGPHELRPETLRSLPGLSRDAGSDRLANLDQLAAGRLREQLRLTGCLEQVHEQERVRNGRAGRQQTMIAQDQGVISDTLRFARNQGIIADYLQPFRVEVHVMLFVSYRLSVAARHRLFLPHLSQPSRDVKASV
jgi:hypothetical protein